MQLHYVMSLILISLQCINIICYIPHSAIIICYITLHQCICIILHFVISISAILCHVSIIFIIPILFLLNYVTTNVMLCQYNFHYIMSKQINTITLWFINVIPIISIQFCYVNVFSLHYVNENFNMLCQYNSLCYGLSKQLISTVLHSLKPMVSPFWPYNLYFRQVISVTLCQ